MLDLSLDAVCACGRLPAYALRSYGYGRDVFYFECLNKRVVSAPTAHVFNAVHFVVRVGVTLGLRSFAYNLQLYTSMLCNARLRGFSQFSAFSLVVLRLECFAPSLGLRRKLCLALEDFIKSSGSELV